MIRALILSGTVHFTLLCFAHFGVGPSLDWLGGLLALGWEFILALLLLLLAFLLFLIFGATILASMGAVSAAAVVVAAVAALSVLDQAPATAAAQAFQRKEMARKASPPKPLDVALVEEPRAAKDPAAEQVTKKPGRTSPKPQGSERLFSGSFGSVERTGINKVGKTVKGKNWTIDLPTVLPSAAEKTVGESLTRQQLKKGAAASPEAKAEPSPDRTQADAVAPQDRRETASIASRAAREQVAHAGTGELPSANANGSATRDRADSPSRPVAKGVKAAFDDMAKVMPRLEEFRQHLKRADATPASRPGRMAPRPVAVPRTAVEQQHAMKQTPQQAVKQAVQQAAQEAAMARIVQRAEEGYAHAQFNLAETLLTSPQGGEGVARARQLLEQAAVGGYLPAQVVLALMEGEGVAGSPPNLAKAHAWLEVAAARGSVSAAQARDTIAREFRSGDAVKARLEAQVLKKIMSKVTQATGSGGEREKVNEQLRHAAVLGDVEALYVLLAKNADADDADQDGRTPLIEAAWRGHMGIVSALVGAGARIDSRDKTGKTSVAWAAINGHADVVAELLKAGSSADISDDEGFTPLMRAAWNGHVDVVRALIRAGADSQRRNQAGRTATDYARDLGLRPVLQALAAK